MANNLYYGEPADGKKIATLEVTAVHHQRMILEALAAGLPVSLLSDADGHLQVDVLAAPSTAVTGTFWQATQPVSLASLPALAAGTAEIGKLAAGTAAIGSVTLGAGTAEIGKLAAGTAEIGKLATGTASIGSVTLNAPTTGGLTTYRNLDIDETGVNVKASAGQVFGWAITNNAAAVRFVKLYNKATAPTSGDTPLITLEIPAGAMTNVSYAQGIAFATGIGVRATTGVADNDTGAPAANDVVINLFYS